MHAGRFSLGKGTVRVVGRFRLGCSSCGKFAIYQSRSLEKGLMVYLYQCEDHKQAFSLVLFGQKGCAHE